MSNPRSHLRVRPPDWRAAPGWCALLRITGGISRYVRRFGLLLLVSGVISGADGGVAAAGASFARIAEDAGLGHADVRDIAQDQEGFLWFGLRLGGLARFDGYELQTHTHNPADPRTLGHPIIWSLLVDRSGGLWIGTEGGLDRFDHATGTFTHFRHDPTRPDSLANNVVICLAEDANGQIWAGTREGLCRLDDPAQGIFTSFRRPQVIANSTTTDAVRSIATDARTGLLWLGTSDGLAAFDPRTGAFATFLHDPADQTSLSHNSVGDVLWDDDGTFYALTEHGLNAFHPEFTHIPAHAVQEPRLSFQRFLQPASIDSSGINFLRDGLLDHCGRLWLGSRSGLSQFDRATGAFTVFRRDPADPTSLSDDLILALFEDRATNLWVATYAGGVNRLRRDDKPFRSHRHRPGDTRSLSEDRILGLALDRKDRLWAATSNGLNRRDETGWTRFQHDPSDSRSLPNNDLTTVAVDQNDDVWVGTYLGGVFRRDPSGFHGFPTSPSNRPAPNGVHPFTGWQVNSIFPDDEGGVWLGARAYGLDYFQDGQFLHFNPGEGTNETPGPPTRNPLLGVRTARGELWFATELHGLVRLAPDRKNFTAFLPHLTFGGAVRNMNCIAAGDAGTIWIGTAEGLLQFDTRTASFVREYRERDGMPHAAVATIVCDQRGHLWLGTADGLSDFDPATGGFRNYDQADGLPADVFSLRAGVLGTDGRVYLGTRGGIVEFQPDSLRDNPVPPPVVLTELRWVGETPADAAGRLPGARNNFSGTIRVPAGQPGFSLKFSALDFTAPESNRYRYQLSGWNDEWTEASARERTATYTALPPGTYTFTVHGTNADQVWNETGASVRIVVAPRFWQTTWFRLGLPTLVLGLLLAGLHWRTRVIRQRNDHLEQVVAQRTAQLQQAITVRERAEAALRESHAELEQRVQSRTAELAHTNSELQSEINERKNVEAQLRHAQKMEAIGQLAGGVAHDFNNLLTVIGGQSAILRDPELPTATRDAAVRDIEEATHRATNLTRQLLVLSRRQPLATVALDLNQTVSGMGKLLRHVIGKRLEIQTHLAPGPLPVLGDPGMLEQVLLNLAVNARDAMLHGGRLSITTARVAPPADVSNSPGHYVRLSVADTGTGIPPEVLPQIFEPFFTTKGPGKGTGLGLAISQGIALKHGGRIEVETALERGTTFHLLLPEHHVAPAASTLDGEETLPSGEGTTILVVEDEPAVRNLVRRLLSQQGYHVIEASCGPEALALWTEHRDTINVLLTDIVMPGEPDGRGLVSKLRAEQPGLRVVTMSGYDPGDVAREDESNNPHVRKPFSAGDLLSAIAGTRSP